MTFEEFFRKEIGEGKTDFSLRAALRDGVVTFYIHPSGKGGETFNAAVYGDMLGSDPGITGAAGPRDRLFCKSTPEGETVFVGMVSECPRLPSISFDEFVEHGRRTAAGLVNDMPWCFQYKGHPVTHLNDDCYLISPPGVEIRFHRGEHLVL
jgi:hypothetical protein